MNMRIAMVGPWPPESTGIAEYAVDLAGQLESFGAVVTRVDKTVKMDDAAALLAAQDVVVYQLGNHAGHHAWMLPLMAKVPGIIHLHDVILHHFVVTAMHERSQLTSESYAKLLDEWYPYEMQNDAIEAFDHAHPIWERETVAAMPLFEPVVRMATAVVVHSEFAAKALRASFPYLPVQVVSQWYTITGERRQRKQLNTISIIGGGEPNRRFDWVADALARIHDDLVSQLTIEITGQVNPAVEPIIARMGGLDKVDLKLLGRVDDRSFEEAFARADLLIAFRHPTMGETSAIVSKALQYGLPTIVSDQGWYAELPDCVHKIKATDGVSTELANFLVDHVGQRGTSAYAKWADSCYAMSERHVTGARQAARLYIGFLAEMTAASRLRSRVADHLASWEIDPDGSLAGAIAGIDVQCNFTSRLELASVVSSAVHHTWQGLDKRNGVCVRREPLKEGDFKCKLRTAFEDTAARPGDTLELSIRISNLSNVAYVSPRPSQPDEFGIFVGYHWHKYGDDHALGENPRMRLVDSISPGGLCGQIIRVTVPREAGNYNLIVDLVQENVSWFRHKGGEPIIVAIQVKN